MAKAAQNPLSNLITVPFQNNFYFNTGPYDKNTYVLNFQPIVPFSIHEDWNLITRTILPIITSDWEADGGNRWTVPVGAGLGKILKVGKLPLNLSLQGYYNVEKPEYSSDWNIRLVVQFMFPESIFKSSPSK